VASYLGFRHSKYVAKPNVFWTFGHGLGTGEGRVDGGSGGRQGSQPFEIEHRVGQISIRLGRRAKELRSPDERRTG
jgi:hypothetical protein